MAAYVEINNLGKIYPSKKGEVEALKGINLDIRHGEFLSLVGPSGCGKSTLLKCVAGLEPLSGGEVLVKSEAVTRSPDDMGVVFQRDILFDWRTIIDNVLITAEFRKLDVAKYRKPAQELLRVFGLEEFADRHPWELSGGMRQRASICRALLCDPQLLLMDEPFGALDAMTRDELNVELQEMWNATKKTVLFITHSIPEAVYLSDRVAMMSRNPGEIVEIIDIDLPRPRPLSIKESSAFGKYTSKIRRHFTELGLFKVAL